MDENKLNNVCFGKVIFGIEDLLEVTSKTKDTENLGWKIVYAGMYKFNKEDFV